MIKLTHAPSYTQRSITHSFLRDDNHQEYIKKLAFPLISPRRLRQVEFDDIVASFAKDKAKVTIAVPGTNQKP